MFEQAKQGAVDLVRCNAPINLENGDQFADVMKKCTGRGQPRIVVNLERVPLIDSRGLELLVEFQQQCITQGGCMKLTRLSELCRDILVATDVISHFETFDDELAATGSFAQ